MWLIESRHFRWSGPRVTFKVVHLLQAISNEICAAVDNISTDVANCAETGKQLELALGTVFFQWLTFTVIFQCPFHFPLFVFSLI